MDGRNLPLKRPGEHISAAEYNALVMKNRDNRINRGFSDSSGYSVRSDDYNPAVIKWQSDDEIPKYGVFTFKNGEQIKDDPYPYVKAVKESDSKASCALFVNGPTAATTGLGDLILNPTLVATETDADLIVGQQCGPVEDSYLVGPSGSGLIAISNVTDDRVWVVPELGDCKGTSGSDSGSQSEEENPDGCAAVFNEMQVVTSEGDCYLLQQRTVTVTVVNGCLHEAKTNWTDVVEFPTCTAFQACCGDSGSDSGGTGSEATCTRCLTKGTYGTTQGDGIGNEDTFLTTELLWTKSPVCYENDTEFTVTLSIRNDDSTAFDFATAAISGRQPRLDYDSDYLTVSSISDSGSDKGGATNIKKIEWDTGSIAAGATKLLTVTFDYNGGGTSGDSITNLLFASVGDGDECTFDASITDCP